EVRGDRAMNGLMMHYPLTVSAILKRAETLYTAKEIVNEQPDKSWHRYTYRDLAQRAKQLAAALLDLGVQTGDRVATLCWNRYQHLEVYFGVTIAGAVMHTLNPRLHPDDLAYIVNDAQDKVLLVDDCLLPLLQQFRQRISCTHLVVISSEEQVPQGMIGYEQL